MDSTLFRAKRVPIFEKEFDVSKSDIYISSVLNQIRSDPLMSVFNLIKNPDVRSNFLKFFDPPETGDYDVDFYDAQLNKKNILLEEFEKKYGSDVGWRENLSFPQAEFENKEREKDAMHRFILDYGQKSVTDHLVTLLGGVTR